MRPDRGPVSVANGPFALFGCAEPDRTGKLKRNRQGAGVECGEVPS